MGNVNGWRGWAIGHGDAVSPPLSRPYLPNHLGAVMGPVQLSELSQELKPAPARGLDQETVRAAQARAGKAGMERRTWLGPPGTPDRQGPRSEWRGFLCSLGKRPVLVKLNTDILCRRGN